MDKSIFRNLRDDQIVGFINLFRLKITFILCTAIENDERKHNNNYPFKINFHILMALETKLIILKAKPIKDFFKKD